MSTRLRFLRTMAMTSCWTKLSLEFNLPLEATRDRRAAAVGDPRRAASRNGAARGSWRLRSRYGALRGRGGGGPSHGLGRTWCLQGGAWRVWVRKDIHGALASGARARRRVRDL